MKLLKKELQAKALAAIVVLCTAILFAAVIFRIDVVLQSAKNLLNILTPFMMGIVIAFLIAPLLMWLEKMLRKALCRKKEHKTLCRVLATVVTYALLAGVLVGFVCVVVPQLLSSIVSLSMIVTNFLRDNAETINRLFNEFNVVGVDSSSVLFTWENIVGKALEYSSKALSSLVSISAGIGTGLVNFFLALVMSVYMMFYRDRFAGQGKKLACALFSRKSAEDLIYWMRRSHKIFAGYIAGKLLDSLVIGALCYVGMLIFRMDYAVLISVIVGVTNVLPYFGPVIGGAAGCVILFIVSPMEALWFVLFVLVLQQLDGNIIGPRIMGDSIGMSPFWIMLAILIGGGLWGVAGMLISIPLFALIYAYIKTTTEAKLTQKGMPAGTDDYMSPDGLPQPVPDDEETTAPQS